MNRRASGLGRLAVVCCLGGVLVAGGATAGILVVKSKRAAYVRETLAILPGADKAYHEGRFADAVATAAGAADRQKTNPTWFQTEDAGRIREAGEFYAAQLALWKRAETAAAGIPQDPTKARTELDALSQETRPGEGRTAPLTHRLRDLYIEACTKEREKTEGSLRTRLLEALKDYELGSWDGVIAKLEEIRKTIAALPELTRDAAAASLDKELKPVEKLAEPLAAMRAIKDGKDDGPVKADRLRELIPGLTDIKVRDLALHRDLLKAIAAVDPETRKPIAGLKIPKQFYTKLAESFAKEGGLQKVGDPDDTSVIELQGPAHRYAIRIVGRPPQLLIEVDRVRLQFGINLVDNREALSLEAATELSRALRAARHPRAFADEPWVVRPDAPGMCALNIKEKQAWVVLGGRLFEGAPAEESDRNAAATAFKEAAQALEKAVRESASIPEEIRGPMAALLKATHARAPPADHLDMKFCREALQAGYLEAQLPTIDATVAARLKDYREAYGAMLKLRPRIEARAPDKAAVTLFANWDNDSLWRLADPAAKTTTFSTMTRDGMGSSLAAVSVFEGLHDEFPASAEPVEVRMSHGVAGVVSRWTAAGGKLEFDPARWAKAVSLGEPGAIPEHFGTGDWQTPPHALKVDARGQAREIILPAGAVKVEPFTSIAAGPARREAQDRFLKQCAAAFRSPGEYHLFFRYFVQYCLDSPVTTATTLIGSSRHTGDAHQDAYQTLDRWLNGKFLADCDDLAELYWTVLRRQDRPAFVLGVPGHATCGVAEKNGDGWSFFCVDTGPARGLKGADLDAIVEKVLRSYDRDGSMMFDPRQMRFLFRFGGEQTRSDYYLDSRILRDPEYADLMIRVQEYWHFGFYALGIETMSKVLETDRMPANCQEIAGLYTRVGLWEEALKWTEAGIKGLETKDEFTGLSDTLRVVQCLRELKRKDDAVRTLKTAAERISKVLKDDPKQADRYRSLKFSVAAQLADNDAPWDAWSFIEKDVVALAESGAPAESLMFGATRIFSEMKDAERAGAVLTDLQKRAMGKAGELLEEYFDSSLFESDDSSLDLARKYGHYFGYRVALLGLAKATEELVKPEYPKDQRRPDPAKEPAAALSWPWIRLCPLSYSMASGAALDKDDPAAGGPKAAIAVVRALEQALPEIRRQGSLGPLEFQVLDLRLLRGCLEMDEKTIRAVFDEMKRQGWGDLYESLAGTLGRAAEFMKVEDFEKVFRIFCEYQVPRRHYYGVVYSALAAEARECALAASKACIERFPDDADMRREHSLLKKLSK